MGTMASHITSPSGADQRRHQSSASLAFVRRIHRRPRKWPVTRKMFPFDEVIMTAMSEWLSQSSRNSRSFFIFWLHNLTPPLVPKLVHEVYVGVITWKHFSSYWPLGLCWSPVDSPHKGPIARNFDVFFDARLTKRLKKKGNRRWYATS